MLHTIFDYILKVGIVIILAGAWSFAGFFIILALSDVFTGSQWSDKLFASGKFNLPMVLLMIFWPIGILVLAGIHVWMMVKKRDEVRSERNRGSLEDQRRRELLRSARPFGRPREMLQTETPVDFGQMQAGYEQARQQGLGSNAQIFMTDGTESMRSTAGILTRRALEEAANISDQIGETYRVSPNVWGNMVQNTLNPSGGWGGGETSAPNVLFQVEETDAPSPKTDNRAEDYSGFGKWYKDTLKGK